MAISKTDDTKTLTCSFIKGGITTIILTFFFVFFISGKISARDLLLALPFFLILYFVQFSIGRADIASAFQQWLRKKSVNVLLFPTLMLCFYLVYLLINKQNLLQGNLWVLVFILFFPIGAFAWRNDSLRKIGWLDFTVFVVILLIGTLFSVKQNSEIPISGGGFDSISQVIIILSGFYAYTLVRGLGDVGFVPELKWKSLLTALLVWASYYTFVFVFGTSVNFVAVIGHNESFDVLIKSVIFSMIGTFLHTALFEELYFRGILQNMLAKRISQGRSWLIFWQIGFAILLICAFLVGYTLEGKMKWFPALVTVILFISAYFIEKSGKYGFGVYTSLAITGVTFGLVHYHAKSIIYIGLACVAGWAYGYTYIKTKNVFYSALVHTLVNTGVLIFGLKMIL
ncbi:MAG TPA: CPBP family intramembrane glutamic endopeptidase [Prolixibacteraceae bacterium]